MDFAVGGGKGDGNAQTPAPASVPLHLVHPVGMKSQVKSQWQQAQPHLPMKQLTEMDA